MARQRGWAQGLGIFCSALLVLTGCGKENAHDSGSGPVDGFTRNPYLSAEKYGITHIDSAQTDNFADPIPRGTFHVDPCRIRLR